MHALLKKIEDNLDLPSPVSGPIAVAMSGGVDSGTVAAALSKLGYTVIGMTMKLYSGSMQSRPGTCCAGRDIQDAKAVAHRHNFHHYVLDYERKFSSEVIQPFTASYLRGETPIPCVLCNQTVKFKHLLSYAKDLGCQFLLTGHYIRRSGSNDASTLHCAIDQDKDQSYFLFGTTKTELASLRFPLGALTKDETRTLAQYLDLNVAEKRESQDICFVGGGRYSDFIKRTNPQAEAPGDIVNHHGQKIGQHRGILHYTIGQRRGLGIASSQEPLFVTKIDPKTHTVFVGPRTHLSTKTLKLNGINWLGGQKPLHTLTTLTVRVRSSGQRLPAKLVLDKRTETALVDLQKPEESVAKGQACVFYHGDQVLGEVGFKKRLPVLPWLLSAAPKLQPSSNSTTSPVVEQSKTERHTTCRR